VRKERVAIHSEVREQFERRGRADCVICIEQLGRRGFRYAPISLGVKPQRRNLYPRASGFVGIRALAHLLTPLKPLNAENGATQQPTP
jgi:hypothetical protein